MFHNFYADYYTMAGITVASCVALCPAVGLMGRRGGLLMFMIITALASLLQLGLLNLLEKYSVPLNMGESSSTLKSNFSVAFSIIGMFSSHAVSNLSIFFCAEITPTVIRGGGLGLVLASAGFGMLTAPIMELHNQKGYFLHHVIFACCTLICIICILLLPEPRNQPLPESLSDGESYTRQPLLPPRKPGERSLLTKSESREYARVGDTPLHEAAATAISTMDSTASSAIDIQALLDVPVHQPLGSVQLLNMRTLTSFHEHDEIKETTEEYPTTVVMHESPAPSVEDPLLGSIPNTSTPVVINSLRASKMESPPDVILDVLPYSSDSVQESPTTSLIDNSIASATELLPPAFLDVVNPPTAVSPMPIANDSDFQPGMDSSGPLFDSQLPSIVSDSNIQLAEDSLDAPIENAIPLCNVNVADPSHLSTGQSPTPPVSIDSSVYIANETDEPHSPTELLLPPVLDSQVHTIPAQSLSSPIDSGIPFLHSHSPSAMDSIDSGPSSPAALEPSTTINNGAGLLSTAVSTPADSTTPHATGTDSVTESDTPIIMNLTVSSPIDSGVPSAIDFTTTETSTANEVSSL